MPFDLPIPGQTPLDDISGLRDQSITTTAQLNAAEAENIRRAILKYLASKPTKRAARFDLAWTKQLHQEMFANVWTWAGTFRAAELNLGSQPYQIETHLHALLDNLHQWSAFSMPMIEQAARLHHGAVKVHPFLNGNGRWARLLTNIWLKLNNQPLILWPEQTIGSTSPIRAQYIAALQAADQADFTAFIKLHQEHQASDSTE